MTEKREQVAKQCDAIAHLCKQIESVHTEYAKLFREGAMDGITDQVGRRTAALMEDLGDFLNSVDAVAEGDEWLTPVFEKAHELWPVCRDDEPTWVWPNCGCEHPQACQHNPNHGSSRRDRT